MTPVRSSSGAQPPNPTRRFSTALPPDLIDELASIGKVRRVHPNTIVAHEGENGEFFCVVKSGVFRVLLTTSDGRSVLLGHLAEGEFFGETLIDGGARMASVASCGRSELICISRRQFLQLLAERPDFTKNVLVKMTGLLRSMMNFNKRLALLGIEDRVKLLLVDMAEEHDEGLIVRPQAEPAGDCQRVGASRSMINRVMKELDRKGLTETHPDGLVLRLGSLDAK